MLPITLLLLHLYSSATAAALTVDYLWGNNTIAPSTSSSSSSNAFIQSSLVSIDEPQTSNNYYTQDYVTVSTQGVNEVWSSSTTLQQSPVVIGSNSLTPLTSQIVIPTTSSPIYTSSSYLYSPVSTSGIIPSLYQTPTSSTTTQTIPITSQGPEQLEEPWNLNFFQQQGSYSTWTSDGTKYIAEVFPTYTITLTTISQYSSFSYQSYSLSTEYQTSERVSYDYSFGITTATVTDGEEHHRGRWETKVTTEHRRERRYRHRRISYPPFIKTLYEEWRASRRWWRSVIEASIEHIETIMGPVSTDLQLYITSVYITKTFHIWEHGWELPLVERIPELVTYTARAFTQYFTDGRVETFTIDGIRESGYIRTLITVIDGSTITEFVSGVITTNIAGQPVTVPLTSYGKDLGGLTMTTATAKTASAYAIPPVSTVLSTVDQAGPYTFTTTIFTKETHLTDDQGEVVTETIYYVDTPTVTPIVQTETVTGTYPYTTTVSTEVTYTVGDDGYTTPDTIYHVQVPPTTSFPSTSSSSSTKWRAIWENPALQMLNPPWIQIATGSNVEHISVQQLFTTTSTSPYMGVYTGSSLSGSVGGVSASGVPVVNSSSSAFGVSTTSIESMMTSSQGVSVMRMGTSTPMSYGTDMNTTSTAPSTSSMSVTSTTSSTFTPSTTASTPSTSTTSTTPSMSTTSTTSSQGMSVMRMGTSAPVSYVSPTNATSMTPSMPTMSTPYTPSTTSSMSTMTTMSATSTTLSTSSQAVSVMRMGTSSSVSYIPSMNTTSSMFTTPTTPTMFTMSTPPTIPSMSSTSSQAVSVMRMGTSNPVSYIPATNTTSTTPSASSTSVTSITSTTLSTSSTPSQAVSVVRMGTSNPVPYIPSMNTTSGMFTTPTISTTSTTSAIPSTSTTSDQTVSVMRMGTSALMSYGTAMNTTSTAPSTSSMSVTSTTSSMSSMSTTSTTPSSPTTSSTSSTSITPNQTVSVMRMGTSNPVPYIPEEDTTSMTSSMSTTSTTPSTSSTSSQSVSVMRVGTSNPVPYGTAMNTTSITPSTSSTSGMSTTSTTSSTFTPSTTSTTPSTSTMSSTSSQGVSVMRMGTSAPVSYVSPTNATSMTPSMPTMSTPYTPSTTSSMSTMTTMSATSTTPSISNQAVSVMRMGTSNPVSYTPVTNTTSTTPSTSSMSTTSSTSSTSSQGISVMRMGTSNPVPYIPEKDTTSVTSSMSTMSTPSTMSTMSTPSTPSTTPSMSTTSTTSSTSSTSSQGVSVMRMGTSNPAPYVPEEDTTSVMSPMSTPSTPSTTSTTPSTSSTSSQGMSVVRMGTSSPVSYVSTMNTTSNMSTTPTTSTTSSQGVSVMRMGPSTPVSYVPAIDTTSTIATTSSTSSISTTPTTSSQTASVVKMRNAGLASPAITMNTLSSQLDSNVDSGTAAPRTKELTLSSKEFEEGRSRNMESSLQSDTTKVISPSFFSSSLSLTFASHRVVSAETSVFASTTQLQSAGLSMSTNKSLRGGLTVSTLSREVTIAHIAVPNSGMMRSRITLGSSSDSSEFGRSVGSSASSFFSTSDVSPINVGSGLGFNSETSVPISVIQDTSSHISHIVGKIAGNTPYTNDEALGTTSVGDGNVKSSSEHFVVSSGSTALEGVTSPTNGDIYSTSFTASVEAAPEEEASDAMGVPHTLGASDMRSTEAVHTTTWVSSTPSTIASIDEAPEEMTSIVGGPLQTTLRTNAAFTTSVIRNEIDSSPTMGLLTHFTGRASTISISPWKFVGVIFFVLFVM